MNRRIPRYVKRRLNQYTCRFCGEKLPTLEDYKTHLITKHGALLLPITPEELVKIQEYILNNPKCQYSRELHEIFMVGKLISTEIGT